MSANDQLAEHMADRAEARGRTDRRYLVALLTAQAALEGVERTPEVTAALGDIDAALTVHPPDMCDGHLVIPPKAAVDEWCILPPGHDGYCRSRDGRRWPHNEPVADL